VSGVSSNVAAVITPLWFVVSALGTKYGLWDWRFGLSTLTFQWGPRFLFAALGLGVLALVLTAVARFAVRDGRGAGGWIAAFAAIAVGAGGLWYADSVRTSAGALPPIHDISTDTANPPRFSDALASRRGDDANTLEYEGKIIPEAVAGRWPDYAGMTVSEAQARAYPDIQPIVLDQSPQRAFDAALAAARDLGWRVGDSAPEALVFEATAETFWFGFFDDVAVRVSPSEAGGAIVDVRSVSRVGLSDLGANADRIRAFEARLRERLS